MYYSPYQILLLPIVLVLNYFLLGRLLVNHKRSHVFARMIKPSLWLLILYGYLFSLHAIFLLNIVWFSLFCVLVGAGYGIMMIQEIRTQPRVIVDNILQAILIVISTTLASIALAYWHWPTVLVMLSLWLIMFFLALSWLVGFTNKPYMIAVVWALIVIEIFWISTRWINLYHIPSTAFLLSQAALVVGALAYGFGGLYFHYKNQTLKRALLFEYIGVTTAIFIALMFLSKWSVAI